MRRRRQQLAPLRTANAPSDCTTLLLLLRWQLIPGSGYLSSPCALLFAHNAHNSCS